VPSRTITSVLISGKYIV